MTYPLVFGIIAGILSALCYPPYIFGILKGTVKPSRASWLIWSVLTAMGFFTQLAVGATHSLWLPGVQGLGVIIVFLLSIRYGSGGLSKGDLYTLIAAGIILLLWYFTEDAITAVYLTVLVDALGVWLTVAKSYKDPESETLITWVLSGTAGIFALFAVTGWSLPVLAYPIYIMLGNYAVVAALLLGRRKKHAK